MNYASINERVRMLLQDTRTSFHLMIDAAGQGSALQRPDLRRAELAAMLRRVLKKQASRKSSRNARNREWAVFMTGHAAQSANNNDLPQPDRKS